MCNFVLRALNCDLLLHSLTVPLEITLLALLWGHSSKAEQDSWPLRECSNTSEICRVAQKVLERISFGVWFCSFVWLYFLFFKWTLPILGCPAFLKNFKVLNSFRNKVQFPSESCTVLSVQVLCCSQHTMRMGLPLAQHKRPSVPLTYPDPLNVWILQHGLFIPLLCSWSVA